MLNARINPEIVYARPMLGRGCGLLLVFRLFHALRRTQKGLAYGLPVRRYRLVDVVGQQDLYINLARLGDYLRPAADIVPAAEDGPFSYSSTY